ncbi:hypothetical protein GGX14DRAFT_384106 [Mycena pura]|uniref:Uncharacterized protein n=1 Tax=Mycena pura TaxID=153505 RepID=A0AAD6YUZ9_9AGAR|nr:hypothetical protein GGX14DRAFT_384106 [Mycena pura]
MAQAELGCAQNADGSLKDVSDVVFYNDPDDVHPLPRRSATPALAPIFQNGRPIGKFPHRSPVRANYPAAPRALTSHLPASPIPDNAASASAPSVLKRKADGACAALPQKAPKLGDADSSGAESGEDSDVETDTKAHSLALELLKSGFQNGHISAGEYAAKHTDALIAELNDLKYGFEEEATDDEA